jgi:hypothetical protein
MYAFLRTPQEREKIFSGYTSSDTLTPQALLGQRNLNPSFRQHAPQQQTFSQTQKEPSKVPLEKALDVSYGQGDLRPYGYIYDQSLSTKENKVFYNPKENKVIYTVAGTNPLSLRDIGTDAYLAFMGQSGLKATNRFKESEEVLKKARQKYPKSSKTLVGHSLGSAIVSTLAQGNENVKGFGTGSGLFPEKQVGETYRTFYDPFSVTSDDTLISTYIPKKTGNLRASQKVDYPQGAVPSHSYQNLRNKKIFV